MEKMFILKIFGRKMLCNGWVVECPREGWSNAYVFIICKYMTLFGKDRPRYEFTFSERSVKVLLPSTFNDQWRI